MRGAVVSAGLALLLAAASAQGHRAVPTVSVADTSQVEGTGGDLNVERFTLTRTGDLSATTKVFTETSNGTAVGDDYGGGTDVITFDPGQSTAVEEITTTSDADIERDETFTLHISNDQNAAIGRNDAVATIVDDDGRPPGTTFDVADAPAVTEGTALAFAVTLSKPPTATMTVKYKTQDGTATGADYTAQTGTLSFAAGQTSKTVSVPTSPDGAAEGDETVQLALSGSSAPGIGRSPATGTIRDPGAPSPVPTPSPSPVAAPPPAAPGVANTALPAISRVTASRYSCSPGSWTGLAGAPAFTFTWLQNGAVVASGQTFDVSAAKAGLRFSCRVSAVAASGVRVTADSVPTVLFATAALNPDPVVPQVVGDVRVRGIDVFQVVEPSAGAQQWGPGFGPFRYDCGGGTPTAFDISTRCLFPSGDPQTAEHFGVDLDADQPAVASVYVSVDPLHAPYETFVSLEGSIEGGPPLEPVIGTTYTPLATPAGVLIDATERDQGGFSATIPIPQEWLAAAAEADSGQLRLKASVEIMPNGRDRIQCLVFTDVCEANDTFTLTKVPVVAHLYHLDVGTLELRTHDEMPGQPNATALSPPDFVLRSAASLFPGGSRMFVHDYDTTLEIDVDGRCPARPGEKPFQTFQRTRTCRSDLAFATMRRWMLQSPANQRGYDVLMGVHDYFNEPGVQSGDPLTPDTTTGRQPIFHADDGTLGRPLTAAAHELGHALGLPHADLRCGGPDGGVSAAWPPDDRGRLQGIRFDPDTGERDVDGVRTDWYDFMSYCPGAPDPRRATDTNHWISAFNWNRLRATMSDLASRTPDLFRSARAAGPDTGFVTGSVAGGEATIFDVVPAGSGSLPVAADPASPVRVIATDAGGTVLGDAGAALQPSSEGGSSTFAAPLPAGADAVAIVADGAPLAVRTRSAPPTVRVTAPRRGARVRKDLAVAWTAGDPDHDPLTISVQYAANGRSDWRTVFSGTGERTTVSGDRLAGGRHARVRVLANDGFNQVQATSKAFRVAGAPPQARIATPAAGAPLAGGVRAVLTGAATDAAGRVLKGRALTWFAGRRRLGHGTRLRAALPAGAVKLRLVARDAGGRRGTAARTVHVQRPALMLTVLKVPQRVPAKTKRIRVRVAATMAARLRSGGHRYRVGPKARTLRIRLPRAPRTGLLRIPLTVSAPGSDTVEDALSVVRLG